MSNVTELTKNMNQMLDAEVGHRFRDRRERIATAALQGLLSNPDRKVSIWEAARVRKVSIWEAARVSVEFADALIAELDREPQQ